MLTHKTSIAIISKKLPGFKYIQITTGDAPFAGHGKALKAHGKGFAVCRTRQRAHGKQASAKPAFAVCNFSGTRQKPLPSAKGDPRQNFSGDRPDDVARIFAVCFIEAHGKGDGQPNAVTGRHLCRVSSFRHTAKIHVYRVSEIRRGPFGLAHGIYSLCRVLNLCRVPDVSLTANISAHGKRRFSGSAGANLRWVEIPMGWHCTIWI